MKRAGVILVAGLAAALLGYFGFYYLGTARCRALAKSPAPELAWLKQEFQINDAEYSRICRLHESYLAGCAERCRVIDQKNQHLQHLLAGAEGITPEIETTLLEAAQLRAECHKQMLQYAWEVSRTMPPAQGRRYLAWVQARTIPSDTHSEMHH